MNDFKSLSNDDIASDLECLSTTYQCSHFSEKIMGLSAKMFGDLLDETAKRLKEKSSD
jgi:hypothetical protein